MDDSSECYEFGILYNPHWEDAAGWEAYNSKAFCRDCISFEISQELNWSPDV